MVAFMRPGGERWDRLPSLGVYRMVHTFMIRQFDSAHCRQAHNKWEGIRGRVTGIADLPVAPFRKQENSVPKARLSPAAEIIKVFLKLTEKEGRDRKLIPTEGGAMLIWCVVLLFLGIAAFLDSIFTFGDIFRRINSVMFMLVSLGLLIRTSTKIRLGRREGYEKRIEELEQQLTQLTKNEPKKELKKETAPVS